MSAQSTASTTTTRLRLLILTAQRPSPTSRSGSERAERLNREVVPAPTRDLEPRVKMQDAIAKIRAGKWCAKLDASDEDELREHSRRFHVAAEALSSTDETLDGSALQALRDLATASPPDPPPSVVTFLEKLANLVERESLPEPDGEARRILADRAPRFLLFDDANRILAPAYDINVEPSQALMNLLTLANLDITDLRGAIGAGDQSRVEEIEDLANETLKRRFNEAWNQSRILVRLRVDGTQLHVLASNRPGNYLSITERSDGLRQFVALFAYVERYNDRSVKPILLIDEAENHLHYDAQADLVRVFAKQTSASKIIYTTHSAGCLPQDLGNGVRMIEPTGSDDEPREEWVRSRIRNWFWTEGPGFAPLLIGMGASALAFSAARRALMVEGVVDAMLLPTLFREATGEDDLDFQVAPSLAEITPEAARDIDLVAARVAPICSTEMRGAGHIEASWWLSASQRSAFCCSMTELVLRSPSRTYSMKKSTARLSTSSSRVEVS